MGDRLPGLTAAAGVFAAYLVVGLPLSGLLARRELQRRLTHEHGLRHTVYRQTISRLWLLAGGTIGWQGWPGCRSRRSVFARPPGVPPRCRGSLPWPC